MAHLLIIERHLRCYKSLESGLEVLDLSVPECKRKFKSGSAREAGVFSRFKRFYNSRALFRWWCLCAERRRAKRRLFFLFLYIDYSEINDISWCHKNRNFPTIPLNVQLVIEFVNLSDFDLCFVFMCFFSHFLSIIIISILLDFRRLFLHYWFISFQGFFINSAWFWMLNIVFRVTYSCLIHVIIIKKVEYIFEFEVVAIHCHYLSRYLLSLFNFKKRNRYLYTYQLTN